jgi:RNA polymerase sigma factor (sigma-70 family)
MRGDAELVLAARSGDQGAFADIYDRYADRIHDFCHSILRDRHEAADAMQDTFVLASQRMGQLREPAKLRSWLFAIARHEALRRAKARSRAIPTEDAGADLAAVDAAPDDIVSGQDAGAIVWEAAAGLSMRDQALLDLHVRQGLDGQELAEAIGTTASHAYVLTHRLREQVERSIGALLVARLGRDDCEELQRVLKGWDGTYSPLWRKRVARHVDDCEICFERRKILTSPLSLLAAFAAVPAPVALREITIERMRGASNAQPVGRWSRPSARGGFPPSMFPKRRRRRALAVAATAMLLVSGGFGAYEELGHGGGSEPSVLAPARDEPVATTPSTTTTTTLAAVPETRPATTTTRPRSPAVVPTPAPTPPPDTQGPSIAASQGFSCTQSFDSNNIVTATVGDPAGITSVAITASGPNLISYTPTTGSGSSYQSTINYAKTGTISWTVTARDALGNTSSASGSFTVQTNPC